MALLLQFLMLLLAVGTSIGYCPPREDILPCSCSLLGFFDKNNIEVFCWKVDDVDDVRKALQSVKGIQRVTVEFKVASFESVPSDLFKDLHVTQLTFYNCVLKRIGVEGRSVLEGLDDSIEKFAVQNSFSEDNSLTSLNISKLRALEILHLEGNNVKDLGNEWFVEGPANLKELYFSVNKISRLGDRAFSQLTNIRKLWIDHNKIETLERNMFPSPAVYLNTIHLNDNKITSLPIDLFSNMPELKYVYLDNNSIQLIPEETWKHVWTTLRILHLHDNPLNCDAGIQWTLKENRPQTLTGRCLLPEARKGVDLMDLIDAIQRNKHHREY